MIFGCDELGSLGYPNGDVHIWIMILEVKREVWISLGSEMLNEAYRFLELMTTIRNSKIVRWEESMHINKKKIVSLFELLLKRETIYSSLPLSVGVHSKTPSECPSHGQYQTLCILCFFSIHAYTLWLLFGISKLPASLLLCLGPLLSIINVTWTQGV